VAPEEKPRMDTDEHGRTLSDSLACYIYIRYRLFLLIDVGPATETVISCAIQVSNTLGVGYLEKVYENALAHEINKRGLPARQQYPVKVMYDGTVVGDYVVDLLVDGAIIVELKAAKAIDSIHEAQVLNYLKATGLKVGLILNFGTPRLGIRRLLR
jgi:GxxExxY protein